MKKVIFLLAILLISCTEEEKQKPLVFHPGSYVLNKILSPEQIGVLAKNNYERECYQREYYFCPPLDEVWQMEVVTDVCKDPNEIISISECFQVFECDPSIPDLGDVDCTTQDGYPGSQKKICDKGIKEN